jgi:glyoxylase-like metal-dependent hydrolase (beta-lactamase superfamily II)
MREGPLTRLRRDRVGVSELTVRQDVLLPARLGGPRVRAAGADPGAAVGNNRRMSSSERPTTAAATWTEPGAHPVAPGVWRIPLPLPGDGLKAVNVYAVQDGDGVTLIDGGWALEVAERELARSLGPLGLGLGDIRRFLVTHAHRDHYTQAVAVRRRYGTRVLIGAGERPAIEKITTPGHRAGQSHHRLLARHGAESVLAGLRARAGREDPGDPADAGYERPDGYIPSGEQFAVGDRTLEAIGTPGHTRGHLVFLDRAGGLLFAGDHVLPHITPSVGFEVDPPRLARPAKHRARRKVPRLPGLVRLLPDAAMLPAHGPPGGSVHARVDVLLDHHDVRLGQAAAVLRGGPRTAYEVATELRWTSRLRRFAELDPFNQMLAVFETALHLDLLADRGTVTVREVAGIVEYTEAPTGGRP